MLCQFVRNVTICAGCCITPVLLNLPKIACVRCKMFYCLLNTLIYRGLIFPSQFHSCVSGVLFGIHELEKNVYVGRSTKTQPQWIYRTLSVAVIFDFIRTVFDILAIFWTATYKAVPSHAFYVYEVMEAWLHSFLGAFTKLRNATVSFVMSVRTSVRPSARMEQLGCHWTDFDEIWYLGFFFSKICREGTSIITNRQE